MVAVLEFTVLEFTLISNRDVQLELRNSFSKISISFCACSNAMNEKSPRFTPASGSPQRLFRSLELLQFLHEDRF
jgi:hypothetical protein